MSHEQRETSAFARAAKVTKEKHKASRRWLPYIIGVLGALAVLMILKGNHHQEEKKQAESKQKKVEMASVLIKQQLDALKKSETLLSSVHADNPEQVYPKELIARMNAPTSIYETGTGNIATTLKTDAGVVKEATFIGKGADQEFANTSYETTSVNAKQVPHPDYTIVSGEMLHATLNVAMNSDLPGMVTAMVTTPAYSYTGGHELVPKGSRLIGQYSSAVLQGQSRIFIMWNRLVLPDGVSVDINSPDTDQIGQSGEPADYINRHFWSRFGESVMLSILSAGISNIDVQESDQYNSAQAYRMAVAESLQSSAAGTLQQTLVTKPTLVRYQGARINVFIAHDLSFYDLYQQQGRV